MTPSSINDSSNLSIIRTNAASLTCINVDLGSVMRNLDDGSESEPVSLFDDAPATDGSGIDDNDGSFNNIDDADDDDDDDVNDEDDNSDVDVDSEDVACNDKAVDCSTLDWCNLLSVPMCR
jgi:hypothetical protein